ncbi:S24 family peptidase [Acetobacter sicerae]|uniref:S24 family peptidase n=1 Tax=Acetobacter sicerae TaxID=85325 RepID=A0ABS8VTI7_9PROT|nr:S24 family peptidase [Acetobacter sicerae]MCE0743358.1 S24 family peptidase [Acetobacter sicerae]
MSIARFPAPQGYVAVPTLEPRAGMGGGGIVDGKYLGPLRFFEESFVRNELRAAPEDLCVVEVEGQSMEPLLRHGDTVLVDRRKVNLGMEGIFVLYDGEYVVCKWAERVHGSEPPMVRIRSSNLDFSPYEIEAERCQILGRVVWFARRL